MNESGTERTSNGGAQVREAEVSPLPDEIASRADELESCRRLRRFAQDRETAAPSCAVQERITEALLSSLRPVRPLPSRGVLALGFLAIFGAVSALITAWVGLAGAREMTFWQSVGVLVCVVASAGVVSLSLSSRMIPGEGRIIAPGWLAFGVIGSLVLLTAALFPWGGDWAPSNWKCLQAGCLFALPAAVLAVGLLRLGAPQAWGAVGAAAGLLAGLVGMATLHVGCSLQMVSHLMLQHVMVPVLGALAGYGIGALWSRYRPKPQH